MHIRVVELMTADLVGQADFYAGGLGLPAKQSDEGLEVAAGESRLIFRQAPEGWEGAYHFAFNIPPTLFTQAMEWASARATLYPSTEGTGEVVHANWHARAVYFPDPVGNVVELIARNGAPGGEAPDTFDAARIISVSEIGLAVPDVAQAVTALEGQAGLKPYRDPGPEFAAVGDAHGLLIVVKQDRIWFPDTGVPARPLPTSVQVDNRAGATFSIRAGEGPLVIVPLD